MGSCSLWSWIVTPNVAMCVISPDSLGLPSVTSTCRCSFNSWCGIGWWRAKSWSVTAMLVALQSSTAFVDISWLFTVTVQVITICFSSIDPANTSTLLTEQRKMPKHSKAFKTERLAATGEPSVFIWRNLLQIPRNLSQYPPALLPLQPPWMSEPSSLPHIAQPCG